MNVSAIAADLCMLNKVLFFKLYNENIFNFVYFRLLKISSIPVLGVVWLPMF